MKKIELLKEINNIPQWATGYKRLDHMPFDRYSDGEWQKCTGYAIRDEYGRYWNEYVDSDGKFHY